MPNINGVESRKVLENVTIATSAVKAVIVDLKDYPCSQNRFALEVNGTSGTGVVNVVLTVSIDGVTYFAPTATAVISAVTTTAKRAELIPYEPTFCRFLKLTFTEAGTADLVGVNATLITQ